MSPIPNWLAIAKKEIGQHEKRGGENPRIVEYLHATDLGDPYDNEDETPWCSAFVNWCMQKVGFNGTRSAAALSWRHWGKDITDNPQVGAIVVFAWDNGTGHVGFLIDWDDAGVDVLGGNQSDAVNETRFAWDHVVGVRWPAKTQVVMVDEGMGV